MPVITIDDQGNSLFYEDTGAPPGTEPLYATLIIVHGTGFHGRECLECSRSSVSSNGYCQRFSDASFHSLPNIVSDSCSSIVAIIPDHHRTPKKIFARPGPTILRSRISSRKCGRLNSPSLSGHSSRRRTYRRLQVAGNAVG